MQEGFISLSRKIQEHWLWKRYPFSYGQAWIDLLLLANYEDAKTTYKGEVIICKRGDVNFSIEYLAERWKWSRWKVRNFLTLLEKDEMVLVKATTHRTTVTIVNYGNYQFSPTTNHTTNHTTNRQQADTINKDNKNKQLIIDIVEYLNEKAGKNFKAGSKTTASHISARLSEGYTVDDFKTVIDNKVAEWGNDPKMSQYLRPETLFGTKFEGYLNQKGNVRHESEFKSDDGYFTIDVNVPGV